MVKKDKVDRDVLRLRKWIAKDDCAEAILLIIGLGVFMVTYQEFKAMEVNVREAHDRIRQLQNDAHGTRRQFEVHETVIKSTSQAVNEALKMIQALAEDVRALGRRVAVVETREVADARGPGQDLHPEGL